MQSYITNYMIIQPKQNMRFTFFLFFFVRGRFKIDLLVFFFNMHDQILQNKRSLVLKKASYLVYFPFFKLKSINRLLVRLVNTSTIAFISPFCTKNLYILYSMSSTIFSFFRTFFIYANISTKNYQIFSSLFL